VRDVQKFKSGVVTGKEFIAILDHAKANEYAIPAVNCTMSPISNACMEAAKKANAPMIVQFSNGGGYYNIGKGVPNDKEQKASVAGTIAGALHVRAIAEVRNSTRRPRPSLCRDLFVNCAPHAAHPVARRPPHDVWVSEAVARALARRWHRGRSPHWDADG